MADKIVHLHIHVDDDVAVDTEDKEEKSSSMEAEEKSMNPLSDEPTLKGIKRLLRSLHTTQSTILKNMPTRASVLLDQEELKALAQKTGVTSQECEDAGRAYGFQAEGDVIKRLGEFSGWSEPAAMFFYIHVLNAITDLLVEGSHVDLPGFGRFSVDVKTSIVSFHPADLLVRVCNDAVVAKDQGVSSVSSDVVITEKPAVRTKKEYPENINSFPDEEQNFIKELRLKGDRARVVQQKFQEKFGYQLDNQKVHNYFLLLTKRENRAIIDEVKNEGLTKKRAIKKYGHLPNAEARLARIFGE